jgi:hypothetical protein
VENGATLEASPSLWHPVEDEPVKSVACVGIVGSQELQDDEWLREASGQVGGMLKGEIPVESAVLGHPVEDELALTHQTSFIRAGDPNSWDA